MVDSLSESHDQITHHYTMSNSDEDLRIILRMPPKPQDETAPVVSTHPYFTSMMHLTFEQRSRNGSSTDSDLEKIFGMRSPQGQCHSEHNSLANRGEVQSFTMV